jgi:hypothetical protein
MAARGQFGFHTGYIYDRLTGPGWRSAIRMVLWRVRSSR